MRDRFSGMTRWFLYVLIGSIGIGAVLAIAIVLAGNWGWFETRILLTTGTIALASVFGMACAAAITRTGSRVVPGAGIGLAVVAAVLVIIGMWLDMDSEVYWKSTVTVAILAVSSAHVALLSIASLLPERQWIQRLAYGLVFAFGLILIGVIWWEPEGDAVVRVLAVVGILDAAFTLLVPVLYFLDRRSLPAEVGSGVPLASDRAAVDAEIARLRARIAELEQARDRASASDA